MTAQPLLQFGTVALDPAPDCRGVRLQPALAEQLFGIAQRERVPKRRCQRTARRISSGSVCRHLKIAGRIAFFMISSGYQLPSAKVAPQPGEVLLLGVRGLGDRVAARQAVRLRGVRRASYYSKVSRFGRTGGGPPA